VARAGDVGNWSSHRVNRHPGLLLVAAARRATCQSVLAGAHESSVYACKIKETVNGCRRRARGQTWEAQGVLAQRRFERNVQIDEQSGAAQNGQDQTQGKTDTEAKEEVDLTSWVALHGQHTSPPSKENATLKSPQPEARAGVLIPFALRPSLLSTVLR